MHKEGGNGHGGSHHNAAWKYFEDILSLIVHATLNCID